MIIAKNFYRQGILVKISPHHPHPTEKDEENPEIIFSVSKNNFFKAHVPFFIIGAQLRIFFSNIWAVQCAIKPSKYEAYVFVSFNSWGHKAIDPAIVSLIVTQHARLYSLNSPGIHDYISVAYGDHTTVSHSPVWSFILP